MSDVQSSSRRDSSCMRKFAVIRNAAGPASAFATAAGSRCGGSNCSRSTSGTTAVREEEFRRPPPRLCSVRMILPLCAHRVALPASCAASPVPLALAQSAETRAARGQRRVTGDTRRRGQTAVHHRSPMPTRTPHTPRATASETRADAASGAPRSIDSLDSRESNSFNGCHRLVQSLDRALGSNKDFCNYFAWISVHLKTMLPLVRTM
jgi:hypothetical protein